MFSKTVARVTLFTQRSRFCAVYWAQLFKASLAYELVKGHFVNCFSRFNIQYSDIFLLKKYSHFFSKKIQHICVSLDVNFNESLTNDVVSFEQLGPGVFTLVRRYCTQYDSNLISSNI